MNSMHMLRRFGREKSFVVTALLILAVCIGANLTIFAILDAVLLRPLPVRDSERLVTMYNSYPKAGVMRDESSLTNYYERRGKIAAFSSMAIFWDGTAIAGETGSTEREQITRISPDFFSTLGLGLALGREFTDEEMSPQTDAVAILTDSYRRQQFAGDPDVIGKTIRVNGTRRVIVGVLPAGFRFLSSEARFYLPFSSNSARRGPGDRHPGSEAKTVARLAPGMSLAEAQSQLDSHNAAVGVNDPLAKLVTDAGFHTVVVPLRADHVAGVRDTLILTQAAVLMLLLIGAVNLINLLLVRGAGRMKEVAIRIAIGSSRARIVKEVLGETMIITLAGGLCGLAVGAFGIELLARLGAGRLPLGAHLAVDSRLAFVALVGTIVMGVMIALPTAWLSLKARLSDALQSQSRTGTAGIMTQRLRHGFIVAQIAFAFVLLAGGGLLALSLRETMSVSSGFRPASVLSGEISLPASGYGTNAALVAFTEKLVDEMRAKPGVTASGIVTRLPFSGNTIKSAVTVEGYVVPEGKSVRGHYRYGVMGEYFETLGIPLLEGRFLESADSHRPKRVCVVDEAFARRYWPKGGAIGRRLYPEPEAVGEPFTVVGIAGSIKQGDLTDDLEQGAVYLPFAYQSNRDFFVVTRTALKPESLQSTLQSVVRGIDAELPVADVRTMETRIADTLIARRSPALLTGIFAMVALLLTAIGIYGVLSYAVGQRRREIGVRMALGAQPADIRRQFLFLGARLVGAGATLGLIGAILAERAIQSILYNVPAVHIATLVLTTISVTIVTLFACLLPSRRAARTSLPEIFR